MRATTPQIVALGGGGFSMERDSSLLDDYVLSLTDAQRPRICFLPTASGDADHYIVRFYRRFAASCDASHVSLFRRDHGAGGVEENLASHLLAQDLIYVGGGNVVSMLGAWRAHGLDDVLRRAWRKGIVLCGPSAGSLCWFDEALSAFHGAPRNVRGLGLLPYSNCVHYDAEPARRAEYHRFVADGMRAGFAVDDGVALHFRRTRLSRVVSSRAGGCAYRVEHRARGVVETPLDVCRLADHPGVGEPPALDDPAHHAPPPPHAARTGGPGAARSLPSRCPRDALAPGSMSDTPEVPFGERRIFAMGGGGFTMEPGNPLLDDFVLSLTSAKQPRVLFLPTASGDTNAQINAFRARFADRLCVPEHLSLFRLHDVTRPLREVLLGQDV